MRVGACTDGELQNRFTPRKLSQPGRQVNGQTARNQRTQIILADNSWIRKTAGVRVLGSATTPQVGCFVERRSALSGLRLCPATKRNLVASQLLPEIRCLKSLDSRGTDSDDTTNSMAFSSAVPMPGPFTSKRHSCGSRYSAPSHVVI